MKRALKRTAPRGLKLAAAAQELRSARSLALIHKNEGSIETAMIHWKNILFISVLGISAIAAWLAIHNHIVSVNAAKLEHVVPPAPYFPPGAIWNQDVSNAPVDPESSDDYLLACERGWMGKQQQDASRLRLPSCTGKRNHSVCSLSRRPRIRPPDSDEISTIPLPAGGGAEGQTTISVLLRMMTAIYSGRPKHGKLYEAYQANSVDKGLTASFVAVWDLNRVYPPSGRGEQCTSADAAGFPIAPLLFNADELATGSINHAIRFILPNARMRAKVYVHPASHAGSPRGPACAPPYGAHFRLKASYDVSQLSPRGTSRCASHAEVRHVPRRWWQDSAHCAERSGHNGKVCRSRDLVRAIWRQSK